MLLRLALIISAAVSLWAQCDCVRGTAGCNALYKLGGSPNPDLATYVSNFCASLSAINSAIAQKPQPQILVTAQIIPASGAWLSSGVSVFGPEINDYTDKLKALGVTTMEVNLWPAAFSSAAEYSPGVGESTLASDCAGGVRIAKNAGVPAGTAANSRCAALAWYDSMSAHATAIGVTLRAGFFPMNTMPLFGWMIPAAQGTYSEPQFEGAVLPLIRAAMSRLGAQVTSAQPYEEPTGGMASIEILSVADVGTFLQHASAAIKAISPSTKVGAAATGISWPHHFDTDYWTDWTTGNVSGAGTPAALDFLGVDWFGGQCDLSNLQYYDEMLWYEGNFFGSHAGGKELRVEQSDRPRWCPAGSPFATEGAAYLGADDDVWRVTGLQVAWQETFFKMAAANGFSSAEMFCTLPLFNYTTNQSNDNCSTGSYSGLAMANLAPTDAAASYAHLAAGDPVSLQGNAYLTGAVRTGH